MEIRRILFPTDFSANAHYALQHAVALARKFGAKLHLLHVVYSPPHTLRLPEDATRLILEKLVKDAEKRLEEQTAKIKERTVVCHPVVRVGGEHSEISAFAAKEQIDLIVMGTHGRTGLAHAFLGSVAERVVRHAPCPVLTVKLPAIRGRKGVKREWVSRSDLRHW